jgi:hypothetical protein
MYTQYPNLLAMAAFDGDGLRWLLTLFFVGGMFIVAAISCIWVYDNSSESDERRNDEMLRQKDWEQARARRLASPWLRNEERERQRDALEIRRRALNA